MNRAPHVWIDRGPAMNGQVDIRTQWRWREVGGWERLRVDALIRHDNMTVLAPIWPAKQGAFA